MRIFKYRVDTDEEATEKCRVVEPSLEFERSVTLVCRIHLLHQQKSLWKIINYFISKLKSS